MARRSRPGSRSDPPSDPAGGPSLVSALQAKLHEIEDQRDRLARRRRRELLIVGVGLSLLVHIALMYYLASVYRLPPGGGGPEPASFEFAILREEELTELESTELSDALPEVVSDLDESVADEPAAELDPSVPAPALEIARLGSMPTLGGAGEGGAAGLGGLSGGAGTSFFGVSSRGTRFAYIVDRSGSMGSRQKMQIAKRELAASIDGLPDYAFFHVVLFSSDVVGMPGGRSWVRARKPAVSRFLRWLNDLDPGGGTEPMGAFHEIFALDVPPDVIFFLTDGEIPGDTAQQVGELNDRAGRVIINTIAFGDARSQEQLKRIAAESGGVYLYVPRGEAP